MRTKILLLIPLFLATFVISLAFAAVKVSAADNDKDMNTQPSQPQNMNQQQQQQNEENRERMNQGQGTMQSPYGSSFASPYYGGLGNLIVIPNSGYGYGGYLSYPYYNQFFTNPYYNQYYAAPYYGGWSGLYVSPWWWR